MEYGKTNEGDTGGKEVDKVSTENLTPAEQVKKDTEILKAMNDAYDVEKLRAETARAERQRGGESNAGQNDLSPEEKETKDAQAVADEISGAFI